MNGKNERRYPMPPLLRYWGRRRRHARRIDGLSSARDRSARVRFIVNISSWPLQWHALPILHEGNDDALPWYLR